MARGKQVALTVNGITFTQKQVQFIVDSVTTGKVPGQGSTCTQITKKIQAAYPDWNMPSVQAKYRFAYREALVRL